MKRIGLITVFLLMAAVCWTADAAAQEENKQTASEVRLARVGDQLITREDLDRFVRLLYAPEESESGNGPDFVNNQEVMIRLRGKALEQLIRRKLFLEAAREFLLSRKGTEETVDQIVAEHLEKYVDRMGSPVAFREFLRANGVTAERFRQMQKNTMLINEYLRVKVNKHLHVSPMEVRRYYSAHRDRFHRDRKIVFRQLWVDPQDCRDRREELEKAKRILKRIREGADFGEMADRYSIDRDRREGGLHEVNGWEKLSGWLRETLRSLKPGEVSGVQGTDVGYCIVKLEKVVEPHVQPLEEVSDGIRRALLEEKRRRAREELGEELRDEIYVHYYEAGRELAQ